jgi:hypothetical protein
VHHAFAVVSYDVDAKRFTMRAFKGEGRMVDPELKIGDRSIVWSFEDPRVGRMRYTMTLNERGDARGEWFEIGESTRDGAAWTRFFEATLRKVP